MAKKIIQTGTVLLFITALFLPMVDAWFEISPDMDLNENRILSEKPEWSWDLDAIADYPEQYEDYHADNFGFRDVLIQSYSNIQYHALGVSPKNELVTLGKEDWLFFTPSIRFQIPQESETRNKVLINAKVYFELNKAYLSQQGIEYVLVIAPDKKDIYREYVPDHLKPADDADWSSEVITDFLKENTSVTIVDLRVPLLAHKEKAVVYKKTDSHWNTLGALVATEYLVNELEKVVPNIRPAHPLDDFTIKQTEVPGGDLARMIGLSQSIPEPYAPEVTFNGTTRSRQMEESMESLLGIPEQDPKKFATYVQTNPTLPNAVMFMDSFGIEMAPLIREHFRNITCYRKIALHEGLIEKKKPDVVIHLLVGRQLQLFNLTDNEVIQSQ